MEVGWKFEMNSVLQNNNILLSSINSACNPLIYSVTMPRFRNMIIKIFFPFRAIRNKIEPVGGDQGKASSSVVSTASISGVVSI